MQIGERILHYRKKCNLTQEDVAVALDTTPQNIYKYEKGIIKNIPLSSIIAMANVFGISPAELAGIDTPMETKSSGSDIFYLKSLSKKLKEKRAACSITARELAIELRILPLFIEGFEAGNFEGFDERKIKKISAFLEKPENVQTPEFYYPKFTSSDYEALSTRSRIAQSFFPEYITETKKSDR